MAEKTPDPRIVYADIIDLPQPESSHPRMSLYKRAAQFAPFAALSGYDEMIHEETRTPEVSHKRELEDLEVEMLNQKLRRLVKLTEAGEHPTVIITYFEQDLHKSGGQYVTITDSVKRVDSANKVIELMTLEGFLNKAVAIERISHIRLEDEDDPDVNF